MIAARVRCSGIIHRNPRIWWLFGFVVSECRQGFHRCILKGGRIGDDRVELIALAAVCCLDDRREVAKKPIKRSSHVGHGINVIDPFI